MRRCSVFTLLVVLMVGVLSSVNEAFAQEGPVARAEAGMWGLQWRFGGLATLSTNNNDTVIGELTVSQIVLKYVPNERFRIPFFVGTGLMVRKPEGTDAQADWGLSFGGGFEYHFRIWRRISPFFGAGAMFQTTDPSGENNWRVVIAMGPQLGIEYFIGDRVSLQALYQATLGFAFQEGVFRFAVQTQSGGLLGLTAYF